MILVGIYLLDSALKNRRPIETAKTVIASPKSAKSSIDNAEGYGSAATLLSAESGTASDTASGSAAKAIEYARAQIGKPYVWAATGPNGFDCSGLTWAAWRKAGYTGGRWTTASILANSKFVKVAKADLIPGDLVFPFLGHVMLYAGNGMVIEAPGRGRKVLERKMTSFWTARRVPGNDSKLTV